MNPNILQTIVEKKRKEVSSSKRLRPLDYLVEQLDRAPSVRDFKTALTDSTAISLIAEIKKASPSAGLIRDPFDPIEIALAYEQSGAHAISILTDESFFQGHLDYLSQVRERVSIPILRKDFLIDPYQLVEARVAGADAILLIAEILSPTHLKEKLQKTWDLGMEALVEFYLPENLPWVIQAGPRVIGVNNRDLRTFHTDLKHTLSLRDQIPTSCVLVSESGIRTREDVLQLEAAGVHAILVGESLMRSSHIGESVLHILGQ